MMLAAGTGVRRRLIACASRRMGKRSNSRGHVAGLDGVRSDRKDSSRILEISTHRPCRGKHPPPLRAKMAMGPAASMRGAPTAPVHVLRLRKQDAPSRGPSFRPEIGLFRSLVLPGRWRRSDTTRFAPYAPRSRLVAHRPRTLARTAWQVLNLQHGTAPLAEDRLRMTSGCAWISGRPSRPR